MITKIYPEFGGAPRIDQQVVQLLLIWIDDPKAGIIENQIAKTENKTWNPPSSWIEK